MVDYHESIDELTPEDRDIARALNSLKEEIEAVNWYHQRAAATKDQTIKDILIHNRNEEIEHAVMMIEWLRRKIPAFDNELRTYLFTEAPITQVEEVAMDKGSKTEVAKSSNLSIGSLKK